MQNNKKQRLFRNLHHTGALFCVLFHFFLVSAREREKKMWNRREKNAQSKKKKKIPRVACIIWVPVLKIINQKMNLTSDTNENLHSIRASAKFTRYFAGEREKSIIYFTQREREATVERNKWNVNWMQSEKEKRKNDSSIKQQWIKGQMVDLSERLILSWPSSSSFLFVLTLFHEAHFTRRDGVRLSLCFLIASWLGDEEAALWKTIKQKNRKPSERGWRKSHKVLWGEEDGAKKTERKRGKIKKEKARWWTLISEAAGVSVYFLINPARWWKIL